MRIRNWTRQQRIRAGAWAATLISAIVLMFVGISTTGAYFSDTHNGDISGTIGSIRVTTSGGGGTDGTDFTFSNLLPGGFQTATLHYQNTGANTEDIWLTFPNATALSALNNLGTFGEIHVSGNGTEVFASANLNDRSSTCGAFSPSGCWPLPNKIEIATNVAPGDSGTVQVTFRYASKLSGQPAVGTTASFNPYPIAGETTTNAADGTGAGLPFALVATQQGQQP